MADPLCGAIAVVANSVNAKIKDLHNTPAVHQRLIFSEQPLKGGRTLRDDHIVDGATALLL
jgi:hypothetical protein